MKRYIVFISRKNIVKMTILPKARYIFNAVPTQMQVAFFHRTRSNSKLYKNTKDPQIAKTILAKDKAGGITLLELKPYCKDTVRKTKYNMVLQSTLWQSVGRDSATELQLADRSMEENGELRNEPTLMQAIHI